MSLQSIVRCLTVGFLGLMACDASRAAEHTADSLATVRENVTSGKAVLVDVREKPEWTAGHVAEAISLPISAIERRRIDASVLESLPKERIIYTYCVVGMRSKKAAAILEQHGYQVRALKPGYEELLKAGFDEKRGE